MLDEDAAYQKYDSDSTQDDKVKVKYKASLIPKSPKYLEEQYDSDVKDKDYESDEICRVCLNPGTIFCGEDSDLCQQLMDFTSIDIKPNDGLPQYLCTRCQELLEAAVTLRRMAQESDRLLKEKILNVEFESQGSQCESQGSQPSLSRVEVKVESSDEENSQDCVYLEYAETINESENRSTASDIEESNGSFKANSVTDSIALEPEELKGLVDTLHKKSRFTQCEPCNITFRTVEQLNEHFSVHNSEEIISCEVCKNLIHTESYSIHLKLHRELYNQRLEKKYQKVECTVCKKYISKSYIKVHMLMHGSLEEKAERFKNCNICNELVCGNYLNDHIKRVHTRKEPEDKKVLRIKCPLCSRMFKESIYEDHVASHATRQKKYVCEECGKEFFSASSFGTHTLIHKEEYKFKCQFCPYQGKHLGLLKVHVRTHTKDYSYKCKTCNARFITKSNLSTHEKTHLPGVKFVCPHCGKCFATERTLKKHTVCVHEGIRPFPCDICGKSYGYKDVLIAHKKRVHNIVAPRRIGRKPSYLLKTQESVVEDVS